MSESSPVVVHVVCTDAGQHRALPVADFVCTDRGASWGVQLRPAVDIEHDQFSGQRIRYDSEGRAVVAQLWCNRCHRTSRHSLADWARLASKYAEAGMLCMDVSRIPGTLRTTA